MSATSIESSGLAAVTIADGTSVSQLESSYDVGFRQRLCLIGSLVAIAVLNETGGTTSRTNYARQFLANPTTLVENSVSFAVPADGVTGTSSTDQDVANRIGDLWNILSAGY